VWGGGAPGPAAARHREGADVVAWAGADPAPLVAAGIPVRSVEERIGEEGCAAAGAAERRWARLWGRVPLRDGRSFRDLVTWRDTSLLWLAESFIRSETAGPRCARVVETSLRLLDAAAPDEVDTLALPAAPALLLVRACTARGVLFHGAAPPGRPLPATAGTRPGRWGSWRDLFARGGEDLPPATSPGGAAPDGVAPLLVLAAASAERASVGSLAEDVGRGLGRPVLVVEGAELRRSASRRVRREVDEATRMLREHRDTLRGTPGVHESYAHRGIGFADLAEHDLDRVLLGRLPEAVRLLEAASERIDAVRPAAVLVAGWPRDDRRCLVAAARIHAVPAVVVRVGPPDPDDVDRADGGPRPAATVGWDPASGRDALVARLAEATRVSLEPA